MIHMSQYVNLFPSIWNVQVSSEFGAFFSIIAWGLWLGQIPGLLESNPFQDETWTCTSFLRIGLRWKNGHLYVFIFYNHSKDAYNIMFPGMRIAPVRESKMKWNTPYFLNFGMVGVKITRIHLFQAKRFNKVVSFAAQERIISPRALCLIFWRFVLPNLLPL